MARTVVAVGLTIAAAGFTGRYVLQAMKHMEPQVKQVFQSPARSAFSGGNYRGELEPKMTKQEAALILGISPTANKGKVRDGRSPYRAAKISGYCHFNNFCSSYPGAWNSFQFFVCVFFNFDHKLSSFQCIDFAPIWLDIFLCILWLLVQL
uniref:DnaJ heat shock protein family (Hsp40) member C19 n=1 Tax=Suricata suricatta TaxID=37032 RepID=A0A673U730_SURSU